jgi:hypothetical protein
MQAMELAIAATLYFSFAAYLFFPTVNAPPIFGRMAIGLCASELVVTCAWAAGRDSCRFVERCSPFTETMARAAGLQIPAMTAATLLISAAYGLYVVRNW